MKEIEMFGVTTQAEATEMAQAAAAKLADAATKIAEGKSVLRDTDLANLVNEVASWQAIATVFAEYERVTAYVEKQVEQKVIDAQTASLVKMNEIARMMSRGADDGWSGRGNDVRRAANDGRLDALKDLMYQVQAEAKVDL